MEMDVFLTLYLLFWLSLVAFAVISIILGRSRYELAWKSYWAFMLEPWKVATFLMATAFLILAAPYSNDPSWDTADSILTGTAAFATAPWALAIIHRSIRKKTYGRKFLVACILFWTPCWIYDLYILCRDGLYPIAWQWNLAASGAICIAAGVFWNIAAHPEHGVVLAFRLQEYPPAFSTPFSKVAIPCMLLGGLVAAMIAWFVLDYLGVV